MDLIFGNWEKKGNFRCQRMEHRWENNHIKNDGDLGLKMGRPFGNNGQFIRPWENDPTFWKILIPSAYST